MIGDRAVLLAKSSTAPCFGQHCPLFWTALPPLSDGTALCGGRHCPLWGTALPVVRSGTAPSGDRDCWALCLPQCPRKAQHCRGALPLRDLECHRDLGVHPFLGT